MTQLTIDQAMALIGAEIEKQGQSPFKGAGRRHHRQLATDVDGLGIGGNVVFESKAEPSPSSGKPSQQPKRRRAERKGASTTGSNA